MSRSTILLLVLLVTLAGCKGKLPTALTASKRNNSSNVTSATPLGLGKPAHELSGELIFGPEPSENLKKDDLVVVTWNSSYEKIPEFFYHFHLFPKVRYVQYVSETDEVGVMNQIRAFRERGQETEGLSVLKVQGEHSQYLGREQYDWDFKIIQNGVLVANATSDTLDHTISKVIEGKFDTAKQASDFINTNIQGRLRLRTWYRIFEPYEQGKFTFAQFTDAVLSFLEKMKVSSDRSSYSDYYLSVAGCRPMAEISQVYKILRKTDSPFYTATSDINRHLLHPECRNRVLRDFDLALSDKTFREHSGTCRTIAEIAIKLEKKEIAKELLRDMMRSPDLRPRYAVATRDYFQKEYDDLMWRTTH